LNSAASSASDPDAQHDGCDAEALHHGVAKVSANVRRQRACRSELTVSQQLSQVARHVLAWRDLAQQRRLDLAARHRIRAAGVEVATARRMHRAWHIALKRRRRVSDFRIGTGNRGEQRLGIGMTGPGEDNSFVGGLDDAPEYITAMRWLICSTTARLCEMKR